MATEIKYGVVIDNKDIHETGKIRVLVMEQDLPFDYRNKNINELKTLLSNLDKKGNYTPWQRSTVVKNADPYLAEPFLPKQFNLIPGEGQLVKIVIYGDSLFKEYVGPNISSLENQKENYVNALNGFKTVAKKDLIKNGYVNKVEDVAIFGNNSQLLLSNKDLYLRTNFQQYDGKKKNTELSLFQQTTFSSTITTDETKKKVIKQPTKIISHILEISLEKKFREFLNEKTVLATIKLISVQDHKNPNGQIGLNSDLYVADRVYSDGETEMMFTVKTDDVNDVSRIIEQIRTGLLNKKIDELSTAEQVDDSYVATVSTTTYDYTINDYRQMTRSHAVIQDRKEVDVIGFVVRCSPTQQLYDVNTDTLERLGVSSGWLKSNPRFYAKEQNNLTAINDIVNQYKGNTAVESKLQNDQPIVQEVAQSNNAYDTKNDSFSIQASRKILMLSTQVTPNLISQKPDQYGLTQQDLAKLVDPKKLNTYSSVRGENLVSLIIRLIDLFVAHGHSAQNTVKNSLEQGTVAELTKIKEELTKKVNPDLSGGPDLLNQYIRLN